MLGLHSLLALIALLEPRLRQLLLRLLARLLKLNLMLADILGTLLRIRALRLLDSTLRDLDPALLFRNCTLPVAHLALFVPDFELLDPHLRTLVLILLGLDPQPL